MADKNKASKVTKDGAVELDESQLDQASGGVRGRFCDKSGTIAVAGGEGTIDPKTGRGKP